MPSSEHRFTQCLCRIISNEVHISPNLQEVFLAIPCRVKCPYLVKCCPKLPPSIISGSNNFPRFLSIGAIIFSSDSPNSSCSTYITAPANFHNPRYFSSLCKAFNSSGASQARRFTPHKHSGETFDGPPTLERSGYEHRVGRLHPLSFWKGRGLGSGLRTLPQGRDRWGKKHLFGKGGTGWIEKKHKGIFVYL